MKLEIAKEKGKFEEEDVAEKVHKGDVTEKVQSLKRRNSHHDVKESPGKQRETVGGPPKALVPVTKTVSQ